MSELHVLMRASQQFVAAAVAKKQGSLAGQDYREFLTCGTILKTWPMFWTQLIDPPLLRRRPYCVLKTTSCAPFSL